MSMFDPRRKQMSGQQLRVKARRMLLGNGEVEVHDAITGDMWRARHPKMPMHTQLSGTNAVVHVGCVHEDYMRRALKFGTKLKMVADPPEGVRCIICTEEF